MAERITLTDATFDAHVDDSGASTTHVLEFWSSSCQPCKQLSRILEKISPTLPEHVQIVLISVDDNPQLADRFNVQALPTIVILKDGSPVTRLTGVDRPQVIRKAITG